MIKKNKKRKVKMNKIGISLMISYVLLVAMVIALSIGVFNWLKLMVDIKPEVDCKDDTSIIIENYSCDPNSIVSNFELNIKNTGRFNVDGLIVIVGDDKDEFPTVYLLPVPPGGLINGYFYFNETLKPREKLLINFLNKINNQTFVGINYVEKVEIQPFIILNNERIICQDAIKRIPIENCMIKP